MFLSSRLIFVLVVAWAVSAQNCADMTGATFVAVPVDTPACSALVSSTLSLCSTSGTDLTLSSNGCSNDLLDDDLSCELEETASGIIEYCDVLHTDMTLTNGRSAPTGVYTNCANGFARVDLFIDTGDFRSSNPTNDDFTESDICHLIYMEANQMTKTRSIESVASATAVVSSCDELFGSPGVPLLADYSLGLSCLHATPFSDTRRTDLLDALERFMEMYVYIDLNSNSGGDDPVTVDLMEEFDRMSDESYDSDYEFQQDLIETYAQMRDVHTLFPCSDCYSSNAFIFFQPFRLGSRVEHNGEQVIYIKAVEAVDAIEYGFDPAAFIGYRVDRIDGQDALEHVKDFADEASSQKDGGVRFNDVLFSNLFNIRIASRGFIPSEDSVDWRLEHPSTGESIELDIPWLMQFASETVNSEQSFIAMCQADGSTTAREFEEAPEQRRQPSLGRLAVDPIEGLSQDTTFVDASLVLVDRNIAVLTIPHFISTVGSRTFVKSLSVLYLEAIHTMNVEYLLLDVTDNSGGTIMSGYGLAALLDPDVVDFSDQNNFDIIHSDLLDEAMDFYWNEMDGSERDTVTVDDLFVVDLLAGDEPVSGDDWYNPGVQYTRGGHTSRYSSQFEAFPEEFGEVEDVVEDVVTSAEYQRLGRESVLTITDGRCASTCSFFMRTLRQSDNLLVRSVGFGGVRGEALRTSQVPANIRDLDSLIFVFDQLAPFGFTSEHMLVPLPIRTRSPVIALREAYAEEPGDYVQHNAPYPIEFTPSPVDILLQYWPEAVTGGNAGRDVWVLAAQHFFPDSINYITSDYDYWYPDRTFPNDASPIDASSDSSSASMLAMSVFALAGAVLLAL